MTKIEKWLPWVVGVLVALPTLLAYYPPMTDLPLHEGVIGLLLHFRDPAYVPEGLYRLNPWHPNQLFHGTGWLLSLVVGTRWAVKLVIATAQLAIFVTGARLSDHLGRSRWAVLLLTPLALGFIFFWGLVANLLGFAVLLGLMPVVDRANEAPSVKNAVKVFGLVVLAFFAHESVYVIALLLIGIFAILKPLRPRDTTLRMTPAVLGLGVAVVHLWWERRFFTPGQLERPPVFFGPWARIESIPQVLYGSHDLSAQLLAFALSMAAITFLAASRFEQRSANGSGLRERLLAFRFEILGLVSLVGFFVVPFNWRGATLLHERFLPIAWAMVCISAAPLGQPKRIAKLAAAVVPVAVLFMSWPQFVDSDRTHRDLATLLPQIPKGSAVTFASLQKSTPERMRTYGAAIGAMRSLAVNGGRVSHSLVVSSISPVQIRPEYRWDAVDHRASEGAVGDLEPAHDLKMYGFVLVASRDEATRDLVRIALTPEAEFLGGAGQWQLFKSRFRPFPVKSAELAPPALDGDNLLARVYSVEQMLREHRHR